MKIFSRLISNMKGYKCPVCGKRVPYENGNICDKCGWEDEAFVKIGKEKIVFEANGISLDDYRKLYRINKILDPNYNWSEKGEDPFELSDKVVEAGKNKHS